MAAAAIFTFIGPQQPAELDRWQYRGNMTRCRGTLQCPVETAPAARVWVTARWYNPRGEGEPAGNAAQPNLPGGAVSAAATLLAA